MHAGERALGRRRGAGASSAPPPRRCAPAPALQLVGVDRPGSGRGAAAGRTLRRRTRRLVACGSRSDFEKVRRSARRHCRAAAARSAARRDTRQRRPPAAARARAFAPRALDPRLRRCADAGASAVAEVAARLPGARRRTRAARSGANGRSSRLRTPKTASPVSRLGFRGPKWAELRLPALDQQEAFGELAVERLRRRSAVRRQVTADGRASASASRHVSAHTRLREVGQAIVVRRARRRTWR